MKFKQALITTLALGSVLCLGLTSFAADPEPVSPENAGQAGEGEPGGGSAAHLEINKAELMENGGQMPVHPELLELTNGQANPLMQQIRVVMASSDLQLDQLQTRLDSETNNRSALEIIKQMEQVKVQTELDILAMQAGFARQNGREEVALEIEGAMELMTAPRPERQPVDRPASDACNR